MAFLWDGLAILAYFSLVIGVGLASARHHGRSMRDFSVGSRQLPWWAVLASIVAAELSAGTFLGTPGEGFYSHNFAYAQLAIGTIIARVIVAYLFIPTFYRLNVVSIYEFLQIRFGRTTRDAASAIFLVTRLLASGARLYVAAVIVVVGWKILHEGAAPSVAEQIWIYGAAVFLVTALTAVYTVAGGIRAVVWTDVIQATVMGGAVIYAIISLWNAVGGWDHARAVLNQPDDLRFFYGAHFADTTDAARQLDTNGHSFLARAADVLGHEYSIWAALLGSVFITMATHGTDQDMVQRMLTAKDARRSRLALVLSGVADLPIAMGFLFIGVLLAVFYHQHPDPHLPTKNPEIFSYYILKQLPPGARGLLIAGVLATAMGSLSTALNALATSFTSDFWKPRWGRGVEERGVVRAVRWSTAVFAVLLALVGTVTAAVVISLPGTRIIPVVLGIFGYTYGSLLGIFLLGLTTKTRGTDRGNLIAMAAGFLVVGIVSGLPWDLAAMVGVKISPPAWLLQVEFTWRIMFGTLTTYAVAWCFRRKIPT